MATKQLAMPTKIQLHPQYLNSDYRAHLNEEAQKLLIGSCHPEHGYIQQATIQKINEVAISPVNSMPVFQVVVEVEAIHPEVGDQLTGEVCMISPQIGVLLQIGGHLKVLVPFLTLRTDGYDFSDIDHEFTHLNHDPIRLHDEVRVELTRIKYAKKMFSCIGRLVQN